MKIKKFQAATTREALLQVKAELGPDAVILKVHENKNLIGRVEGVEVTAALDETQFPAPALPDALPSDAYNQKGVRKVQWRNIDEENKALDTGKHAAIGLAGKVDRTMQELQSLRQEMAGWREEFKQATKSTSQIPEEFLGLAKGLERTGIPVGVIQDILAELLIICPPGDRSGQQLVQAARRVIAARIPVSAGMPNRKGRSAVVLLVGPTGVGKSTTIAKLAGREILQGLRSVAVITTDCYRMGALEQMQSFASAANIELETVFGPEDVQGALERLKHHDLILVDTAGRSRNNQEHLEELRAFVAAVHPDEVHLVLSLNTRDRDLLEMVELFRPMGVNRLIFTKQDETYELGALCWLPMQTKLPVAFVCSGQRIPDDLVDATRELLASWILGEVAL